MCTRTHSRASPPHTHTHIPPQHTHTYTHARIHGSMPTCCSPWPCSRYSLAADVPALACIEALRGARHKGGAISCPHVQLVRTLVTMLQGSSRHSGHDAARQWQAGRLVTMMQGSSRQAGKAVAGSSRAVAGSSRVVAGSRRQAGRPTGRQVDRLQDKGHPWHKYSYCITTNVKTVQKY